MEYLCPHCRKAIDCGTSSGEIACPRCKGRFTVPVLPVATARASAPPKAAMGMVDLPKIADAAPDLRTLRKKSSMNVRASRQLLQRRRRDIHMSVVSRPVLALTSRSEKVHRWHAPCPTWVN